MSKRATNRSKGSGSPAKKFKRENTTIESIDGKRTSGIWVDLLENGDFIARVIVNVEASENIVLSLILNSLREQYCEVFLNASDFSIYSGLNNEICLPSREEWILESHGGGWSDDSLLVKYTRSDVPNQLIPDEKLLNLHREMRELRKNSQNGVESKLEKPKSLHVSNVPLEDYKHILDDLNISFQDARWNSLPNSAPEDSDRFFKWFPGAKNSPANRTAYMKHLETFPWPDGYSIVDVSSDDDLLVVTLTDYSFTGTFDVALARTEVVREAIVDQHVLLGIELKKPVENVTEEYHLKQVIIQHLCAAYQNPGVGVLTLLTDLNDFWCFFWFGAHCRIFKHRTNMTQAKFLLMNMFNSEVASDCPEGFSCRLSWNDFFSGNHRNMLRRKQWHLWNR